MMYDPPLPTGASEEANQRSANRLLFWAVSSNPHVSAGKKISETRMSQCWRSKTRPKHYIVKRFKITLFIRTKDNMRRNFRVNARDQAATKNNNT